MRRFTISDVKEKYGIHSRVVTELVKAGFVAPERGARREYRFSFEDVVMLRMAQDLHTAGVSPRKTARFLNQLRQEAPRTSAARLRLSLHGRDLVVRDGYALRNPLGQLVLDFTEAPAGQVRPLPKPQAGGREKFSADDWYAAGLTLESSDPQQAASSYRAALERDPHHAGAYINLGCLLVEGRQWQQARELGREALRRCPGVALIHYNLGVVHEELEQPEQALECYRQAVRLDPKLADAHYNLAMLYEASGMAAPAIRHLREYGKLT